MNGNLEQFLAELARFGRAHDTEVDDRRERLRNVEPETARMLAVLVHATGARRLLELGTSNGYSTLWLADAVISTGGRVTTVEIDETRAAMARQNFAEAGLDGRIDLRIEDAGVTLSASPDTAWDFIFLDAERDQYVAYWPDLLGTLRVPGLLAVDNIVSHADELIDFRQLVENEPSITFTIIPIGAGVLLLAKNGPSRGQKHTT
jgi:predicted O-methyltransferase YrrM